MTDEEARRDRAAKQDCAAWLAACPMSDYHLGKIDRRLLVFARQLTEKP